MSKIHVGAQSAAGGGQKQQTKLKYCTRTWSAKSIFALHFVVRFIMSHFLNKLNTFLHPFCFYFRYFQNAWTSSEIDTRNVAVHEVITEVQDLPDTPPYFLIAPPVTKLPETADIVSLLRSETFRCLEL